MAWQVDRPKWTILILGFQVQVVRHTLDFEIDN